MKAHTRSLSLSPSYSHTYIQTSGIEQGAGHADRQGNVDQKKLCVPVPAGRANPSGCEDGNIVQQEEERKEKREFLSFCPSDLL